MGRNPIAFNLEVRVRCVPYEFGVQKKYSWNGTKGPKGKLEKPEAGSKAKLMQFLLPDRKLNHIIIAQIEQLQLFKTVLFY